MCLAEDYNRHVTVLGRNPVLAKDAPPFHYREQMRIAWEKIPNLDTVTGVSVDRINSDSVDYVDADGVKRSVPAQCVVVATGMEPCLDEADAFAICCGRHFVIGDNKKATCIMELMRDAYFAATSI